LGRRKTALVREDGGGFAVLGRRGCPGKTEGPRIVEERAKGRDMKWNSEVPADKGFKQLVRDFWSS
jgi:hypothetical protein